MMPINPEDGMIHVDVNGEKLLITENVASTILVESI